MVSPPSFALPTLLPTAYIITTNLYNRMNKVVLMKFMNISNKACEVD